MDSRETEDRLPEYISSDQLDEILIALKEIMRGNFQHRLSVEDPDGIVDHISVAINQAAEELSRNVVAKEYVERILCSMDDMLLVVDQEGCIRTVNTATCSRLGYGAEELTGKDLALILDDRGAPLSAEEFKALALSGASETLKAILRTRDGAPITVVITTSRMDATDPGSKLIILLAHDMTEVEKHMTGSERSASPWATIEALSEAIVALTLEGEIIQVNSEFEVGSGWKKQEVIGRNAVELGLLSSEQSRALQDMLIPMLMQQGSVRNVEAEVTCKDGTKLPVLTSISLLKDRAGKSTIVLVAVRDISQLKRVEALLQDSNRDLEKKVDERTREITLANDKYNKLFAHSSECILIADDQGQIQDVNPKAAEVLGFSGQEILGLQLPALHFSQILSWCEADRAAPEGHTPSPRELDFRRRNGEVFPVEVSCSALELEGQRVVQIMFRDITKRRQLEKLATERERERMTEEIVDHLPIMVAITDPNGDLIHINRDFEAQLGWSRKDVLGKSALAVGMFSPATHERIVNEVLPELREKGKVRGLELPMLRRDGSQMLTRMNWTLLRDLQGRPSKILHVIIDSGEVVPQDAPIDSEHR